jgi:hypothetical protein
LNKISKFRISKEAIQQEAKHQIGIDLFKEDHQSRKRESSNPAGKNIQQETTLSAQEEDL